MKIAWYHNQAPGGARRAIYELCRELSSRHAVDVFSLDTADETFLQSDTIADSRTVFAFSPRKPVPFAMGFNMFRWLQDFKRLEAISQEIAGRLDESDYDVLLTDPCRFTQASPSILKYVRTPSAYYCHEPPRRFLESVCRPETAPLPPHERARAWVRGRLYDSVIQPIDRRNVSSAAAVLANSKMTRRTIEEYYGRDATVAPLGVDAEVFQPAGLADRDSYVFSVGALAVAKGFDFIVRSLQHCPPSSRPRFVIATNADNSGVGRDLRSLAARYGVKLEICLNVDDDQLIRLYQRAAAFVFASHYEPFGLAVLEAMACGTPVVAVAEGGPSETVVDGSTGLLIPRDEKVFAEAMTRVVDDPGLGQRLGLAAREHVEANWTWESAGARLESELSHMARSKRAALQ